MSSTYPHAEIRTPRTQREWSPRTISVRESGRPRQSGQPDRSVSVTALILFLGVAGELVIPWFVIWLSDAFVFDVPAWLTWLSFGGPLSIGLFAMLVYWTLHALRSASAHALSRAHQGRD